MPLILVVMSGLPGSGKTTLCSTIQKHCSLSHSSTTASSSSSSYSDVVWCGDGVLSVGVLHYDAIQQSIIIRHDHEDNDNDGCSLVAWRSARSLAVSAVSRACQDWIGQENHVLEFEITI
jgi:hypothetical protein